MPFFRGIFFNFHKNTQILLNLSASTMFRQKVTIKLAQCGRDYAERPKFYLPYEGAAALKSLQRAKPLAVFLQKQPDQHDAARKLALEKGAEMA